MSLKAKPYLRPIVNNIMINKGVLIFKVFPYDGLNERIYHLFEFIKYLVQSY